METLVEGYLLTPTNDNSSESVISNDLSPTTNGYSSSSEGEISIVNAINLDDQHSPSETDHSDAVFKFINDMLMEEEDLENMPCMLHDCLALQATEKSLYNALNNIHHPDFDPLIVDDSEPKHEKASSRVEKRNRHMEPNEFTQHLIRGNKQFANSTADEPEPLEMFDHVLLCSTLDQMLQLPEHSHEKKKTPTHKEQPKERSNRGRPKKGGKKEGGIVFGEAAVDLRSILMQCAQAVSAFDIRTANELLLRVRQHSTLHGDGTERLAHYFANAIEARLAGTGTTQYAAIISRRISAADILRAYGMFISSNPFRKMSNLFANKTIARKATGAAALHVIDFGILYGFQWPCLIKGMSERPGGPARLRVTGIEFPQPGFRPSERVEDTGRRLAKYCERFGVPFEYRAIACKWETVRVEDLGIKKDETVVVNCMYRMHNLPDETVVSNSPRDAVLDLIRRINPSLFVQGVAYGTYNTPFFVSRFREALHHFSSLFDMFEATVDREDKFRLLFEEQMFGRDVLNVIACEGTERIERPETHRHWQVRTLRAGFRQLPLDQEIVSYVRGKVRRDYHKDFSVDEDGEWMLQGWKGRVTHAISCWEPVGLFAS